MSIDTIVNNSIKNQENNFNKFISNINYNEIISIVEKIERHKNNNIYFGGVGKSGNLALQFSDLLKSIGLNAFDIDIHRLTHGDLGVIKNNDLLFLFSKSGNTNEIIDIFDLLICNKIIITNNSEGLLKNKIKENDMYISLPLLNEDTLFNSIPSNSLIINQTFFNIIIDTFINKINYSLNKYKINHSGGTIGFNNKHISEFTDTEYISLDYENNYVLNYCLELLTNSNCLCIIFNKNNLFYGILTLKDLIKLQLNDKVLNRKNEGTSNYINQYINTQCTKLDGNLLIRDYVEELQDYKISKIFPIIINNECIGILDYKLILQYKRN
jgi:arabinose-5-phosphate isomerase